MWDGLAVFLWSFIFLAGLFPESVFFLLRQLGDVTLHQAFINSHWFITFACSGFLGWFACQRSRESDVPDDIAFGKGVLVTVLALAAFLPLQIELLPAYLHIPLPGIRFLILSVIAIKGLCWFYLVQLIMRYHLFSGTDVFKNMPLFFPSALMQKEKATQETRPLAATDESGEPPAGME